MKTINLQQGSPEWHAHRANHFNASDAPAMMGISKYKTRDALLRDYVRGYSEEVDAETQRRFDDGHRFEALARPFAEKIIGDELYPVTGTNGKYSASFDGLTMLESIDFEHKSLNSELRDAMFDGCTGADLPMMYQVQMEHQCIVCESIEKVLFMASKWDADSNLIEERHCWYAPNPELRAKIIAGWEQFQADVGNYAPEEFAPVVAGKAPDSLPALRIELTGMVTASNLAEFKETALSVFRNINTDLQTDEDFADAEKTVKWCKDVEDRLASAKQHALSQTADIEALFKALDEISAEARSVRLNLDKQAKGQKELRRASIQRDAEDDFIRFTADLQTSLVGLRLPRIACDILGAMKGKKTIESLRSAANTAVANAKVEARQWHSHLVASKGIIDEATDGYEFLFRDASEIALKPHDDLKAIISSRIADHKASEHTRLDAERDRIRAEEQAKAEAEASRRAEESAAAQQVQVSPQTALESQIDKITDVPANTGASDNDETVRLGDINALLSPLSISADGLAQLGFQHVGQERAAKLYRAADVPAICQAIANHVIQAARRQAAA